MSYFKIATDRLTKTTKCWKVRLSVSNSIFIPYSQIISIKNGKMNVTSPIQQKLDCKIIHMEEWLYKKMERPLKSLGEKFQELN